ncbi:MAG: undecaprenyl-phosphate glucose phosphotransferase [Burkholderiales bacterium]
MAEHSSDIRFRRASTFTLGGNNLLLLVEALWEPLILVLSLWAVAFAREGALTPPYLVLSMITFAVTFPGTKRLQMSGWRLIRSILGNWCVIASLLLFFGYATGYVETLDREAILGWLIVAPASQLAAHFALRRIAHTAIQGAQKHVIIAGVNEHGLALAREIQNNPYVATRLVGFFDDRRDDRVAPPAETPLLGSFKDLSLYAKKHGIDAIYLALPMASQARILKLLDSLGDTTASIYFVPDIFVTDLMQGRMDSVGEIPVVAVCETPFTGMNNLVKRISDIVLSTLIIAAISPLLIAIAAAIKLTSPGPVIFRQRRYGLNGQEIIVSKFRSMTVCEDGGAIQQARKNDTRITPLGAFLRRTSLDELPQFFNVLQGRMSIVGPRPHAVAHNELYRGIIKGYMVRHKVKPGITGWAQINGFRGETDTVDKMKKRIDHDLAYLRNWSMLLDFYIILKTVLLVVKDRHAY